MLASLDEVLGVTILLGLPVTVVLGFVSAARLVGWPSPARLDAASTVDRARTVRELFLGLRSQKPARRRREDDYHPHRHG